MVEITCQGCQAVVPRSGPTQRYCAECSERRDLMRKRLWAREHPLSQKARQAQVGLRRRREELAKVAGRRINKKRKRSITWDGCSGPYLLWQVSISMPFTYAASKNHLYTMRRSGHVALRRESRTFRDELTLRLRHALAGRTVAHNKLWIDILVQKPDHRGDAVNVVDMVCDAIKGAVPVDDRWFCLRRVDWEIAKHDPQIYLKIGQETDQDCQVCSHCGQIRPFSAFTKRRNARLGIDRVCRICRRHGRKLGRVAMEKRDLTSPDPEVGKRTSAQQLPSRHTDQVVCSPSREPSLVPAE